MQTQTWKHFLSRVSTRLLQASSSLRAFVRAASRICTVVCKSYDFKNTPGAIPAQNFTRSFHSWTTADQQEPRTPSPTPTLHTQHSNSLNPSSTAPQGLQQLLCSLVVLGGSSPLLGATRRYGRLLPAHLVQKSRLLVAAIHTHGGDFLREFSGLVVSRGSFATREVHHVLPRCCCELGV